MLWTNPMNMTEKSAAVGLGALMAEPTRVMEQHGWKFRHALGEVFSMGLYCILLFGTLFLAAFLVFQYLRRVKVPVQLQLPTQTQKN